MNWNSASEFFAMGGYGLYVWGSYLVTLAAMSVEPWLAAQRHRRARNQIVDIAAPEQQEGTR
jgi:heme exporter protein D